MFIKFFIFALVGIFLVQANPLDAEHIDRTDITNKLSSWWNSIKDTVESYFLKGKQTFEDVIDEIKKESNHVYELGKEKASEFKDKYNELTDKAKKQIEEQKRIWEERIQEALKSGKGQYEKVKEESKQALNDIYKKWQSKYQDFKQKIKEVLEKERGVDVHVEIK